MRHQFVACLLLLVSIVPPCSSVMASDHYGFLHWVYGWRGRSPEGERLIAVQTSRYGAVFDVETASLTRLGSITNPLPYSEAVSTSSELVLALPSATLNLQLRVGETMYSCIGADLSALKGLDSPSRIIECGRFLQRFDIQGLRFVGPDGEQLDCAARLEVIAWPERLDIILEVSANTALPSLALGMEMKTDSDTVVTERASSAVAAGDHVSAHITWPPEGTSVAPADSITVTGHSVEANAPLPVSYDEQRGWFQVDLPARQFDLANQPKHADLYDVAISNTGDSAVVAPVVFSMEGSFPGITGMTPMLFDKHGSPSGLPVQISKNWHRTPDAPELYEGPWFRGFALVPVPPGDSWEGRLQIVYAHWGGVPAVSHAQLCLVGWGVNQLWDQVAIGSWGETICYDPDINLNRSMIDDIRPLMVHGMGSTPEAPKLWTWTNNVGGGDFLTIFDTNRKRLFPSNMKTAYLRYGPNLTEVVYAGTTDDGAVEMRMTVSSPRCDDVARAYHHIRYDVVKPVAFSRLAFYQLGADNYNDHQFERLARGDRDGMTKEWGFKPGGMKYDRAGSPCDGDAPWWFSAYRALPRAPQGGAWANRGLIVRDWKARLGGNTIERPYAAFFGTMNGIPGMNMELAPPPGLEQLEPGDFVEAYLELVVVPMDAADYYGPNANLRASLEQHGNSWQPVHRLAHHNDLRVEVGHGTLLRSYPILLRADANQTVQFSVQNGAGYVPCTITGVRTPENASLSQVDAAGAVVDACIEANRYKQIDWNSRESCYEVTYNILLDTLNDAPATRYFQFSSAL